MSDEIKKAQEEAQRMAQELGIYEIVREIALSGNGTKDAPEGEWQGCRVVWSSKVDAPSMIYMPNKTVLYCSFDSGKRVTTFRYGSWVEKLKAYSEQITADKKRAETEKADQEKKAKLAPFAAISDDEFEKMVNQIQQ